MGKQIILHCSRAMCEMLSEIIRNYADAAYPPGGSDCSQSARESLTQSAQAIYLNWDEQSQTTHINKRLRTMVKSAIKYHAQYLALEEEHPADHRKEYLLSVLSGEAIDEAGYHRVQQQDRSL